MQSTIQISYSYKYIYYITAKLDFSLYFWIHFFLSLACLLRTFCRTVMKRTKPFIPWHFNGPIITFEISVMKLVKKITYFCPFLIRNVKLLKSRMGENWMYWLHITMEHYVQRVAWHNKVNPKVSVEKEMLDRMHRNAWPRTNIDIPVMDGMGNTIEWRPVECSMDPIEMKASP